MPLISSASVTNASPASVSATVTEVPGPGGGAADVDIHIIVDRRFATPVGQVHNPVPDAVTGTTVSWINVRIAAGASQTFTAAFAPVVTTTPACSTATIIVSGSYLGADYNNVQTPVVCFP